MSYNLVVYFSGTLVYKGGMGLLSTSDEAFLQHIRDGLHNIDVTRRHGKMSMEIDVSEGRVVGVKTVSAPTIKRGILSTEDCVVRQLHR